MTRHGKVRPTEDLIRARPEPGGRSGTIFAGREEPTPGYGAQQEFLVQWDGISRLYSVPEPLLEFGDTEQGER